MIHTLEIGTLFVNASPHFLTMSIKEIIGRKCFLSVFLKM